MTEKSVSLLSNGLKEAEAARAVYHITPPSGALPADVLKPEFWVHVARLMRMGDRIEILSAGAEWYAEVLVMEVGKGGHGGARVAFTHGPVDLKNDEALEAPDEYDVTWGGPNAQWRVMRKADKAVLKKDLPSKEAGLSWIASHSKAMAA